MRFQPILRTQRQGFFSLGKGATMLAGEYAPQPRVFNLDTGTPIWQFNDAGESVYAIFGHHTGTYVATEDEGRVYRNGTQVLKGSRWAMGLWADDRGLWCTINDGPKGCTMYYSEDGFAWKRVTTYDGLVIRCGIYHGGVSYGFGFNYPRERAAILIDGIYHGGPAGVRLMKVCRFAGKLYVTGSPYSQGRRKPPATIYQYGGRGTGWKVVATAPGQEQFQGICQCGVALFATTLKSWRAPSGNAEVWMKPLLRRRWKRVIQLAEPESMDCKAVSGTLYVATRHERGTGAIYRAVPSILEQLW